MRVLCSLAVLRAVRPQKLVKDPAYMPGHPATKPYRYIQQELLVDPPRDNSTDVPAIAALLIGKMNCARQPCTAPLGRSGASRALTKSGVSRFADAIKRWNVTVFCARQASSRLSFECA